MAHIRTAIGFGFAIAVAVGAAIPLQQARATLEFTTFDGVQVIEDTTTGYLWVPLSDTGDMDFQQAIGYANSTFGNAVFVVAGQGQVNKLFSDVFGPPTSSNCSPGPCPPNAPNNSWTVDDGGADAATFEDYFIGEVSPNDGKLSGVNLPNDWAGGDSDVEGSVVIDDVGVESQAFVPSSSFESVSQTCSDGPPTCPYGVFLVDTGQRVPEPASLALFGSALTGLGAMLRRRRRMARSERRLA